MGDDPARLRRLLERDRGDVELLDRRARQLAGDCPAQAASLLLAAAVAAARRADLPRRGLLRAVADLFDLQEAASG